MSVKIDLSDLKLIELLDVLGKSTFQISNELLDKKRCALDELKKNYPVDVANEIFYAAVRIEAAKEMRYSNPLLIIDKYDSESVFTKELLEYVINNNKSNVSALEISSNQKRKEDEIVSRDAFIARGSFLIYLLIQKIRNLFIEGNLEQLNKRIFANMKGIDIDDLANYAIKDIDQMLSQKENALDLQVKFVRFLYDNYCCLNTEHCGQVFASEEKTTMRIYINTPYTVDTLNFITDYANECLKIGLNFDMKAFDKSNGTENNDRLILYSTVEELPIRIRIIELLAIKYPKFKSSLGSILPHLAVPIFPGTNDKLPFYGVCHNGTFVTTRDRKKLIQNHLTYNSYIDMLADTAYLRLVGTYALENDRSMDTSTQTIIKSFVNFVDYKSDPENSMYDRHHISLATFAGFSYKQIYNAIAPYISDVKSYISKNIDQYYLEYNRMIQELHNLVQGFPIDAKSSNVAIDTFYTRKVLEKQNHLKK